MIITHKQLAFILDIEAIEALGKIIFAHCKDRNQDIPPQKAKPYKVTDYKNMGLPQEIPLDVLEKHTGLKLGSAILDISENYLKRPASKKWILCDFPERELQTKPKNKIKIPSALASLLSKESLATIKQEWHERYGI